MKINFSNRTYWMKKSSRLSKWVNISIGLSILGLIGSHFHSKIVPPEETEADKNLIRVDPLNALSSKVREMSIRSSDSSEE